MKRFGWLAALLLAVVIGGWLVWGALPQLVGALPGRVQQRLPDQVLALASTPLPTALPAPTAVANQPTRAIIIPTLPTTSATPTTSPTPQQTNPTQPTHLPTQPTNHPTLTPSLTPTPPPTPLPSAIRLEGLEITPQKFNNCGPTNLSLVLNYYGRSDDQFDIAAVIRPTYDDRNVTPEEMAAYVNETTPLQAAVYRGGDLETLKRLLAAGYPVIIEKGMLPSAWEGWMGHYLTLIGYNEAAQQFISLDTFLGPWDGSGRLDSYDTLADYWSHFNHAFLVIFPPEAAGEVSQLVGERLSDPVTMWQQAAEAAQRQTAVTPDSAFAWFNLGSSLTRLGALTGEAAYYENGAAAFDRARTAGLPWRMLWYQFEPYEAYLANGRYEDVLTLTEATLQSVGGQFVEESYYYRGLALAAMGEEAAANAAFARAREINPTSSLGQ